MKLRALNPKVFTQLMEVLKDNMSDILLHFHPDSIKIKGSDFANTHLTYVDIFGSSLEFYECARYQPVGVSIPKLWQVLKNVGPNDILEMECDGNKEVLNISIINATTNVPKITTGYITYLIDEDPLSIPENIECDSVITMCSSTFYSHLKMLEGMDAEFVKLRQCKVNDKGIRFQLIGVGSSSNKDPTVDIDEAKTPETSITNNSTSRGGGEQTFQDLEMVFPLKKLVQFAKAHCLDEKVGVHLDQRGFLILEYHIKIYGQLRFVIMATNLEDDDDCEEDEEVVEDVIEEEEGEEEEQVEVEKPVVKRTRPTKEEKPVPLKRTRIIKE